MNKPKVLVFDLETFGGLKAHMSEISVFGYKWLGEGKKASIISGLDFPREYKKDFTNDKPLLRAASEIYNSADVVIAHYGERFDRRFINSRIEKQGLPPLKPMRLIDTWRISKDNFALPGNSLNTLLKFFNSPFQKDDLTYEEWRKVQLGDVKALRHLVAHCEADVLGLEWVFQNHLSHYTKDLPNYNLFVEPGSRVCPYCGSDGLRKEGYHYKQTSVWQQYSCKACRKWPTGPMKGNGVIR